MDQTILRIIAFLLFSIIGYFLGKKIPKPKRGYIWVICLLILVISAYIGVNSRMIDFLDLRFFSTIPCKVSFLVSYRLG